MPRFPIGALAGVFFRMGTTIFGGGDPTIAALRREFIDRRQVLPNQQFGVLFALSRITPGTNMLAFCAGLAYLLSGWTGAIVAIVAVSLPSAIIALVLLESFERLMAHPVAAAAIGAMVAAAVGLMFAASWSLLRPYTARARLLRTVALAAADFFAIARGRLMPLQVIALAAVSGALWPEAAPQ